MFKLPLTIFTIILLAASSVYAGELKRGKGLTEEKFKNILAESPTKLPKLWRLIQQIINEDVNITIEPIKRGIGKAYGKHSIIIAPRAFIRKLETHPEDRLVVVLLHEYGHIMVNRQSNRKKNNKAENEYAAFKFSVEHSIVLAENGDTGPIQQLIHHLPLRVKNGKKSDPHNIALKRLTKERFWLEQLKIYQ